VTFGSPADILAATIRHGCCIKLFLFAKRRSLKGHLFNNQKSATISMGLCRVPRLLFEMTTFVC
jgi:hypothetical protein